MSERIRTIWDTLFLVLMVDCNSGLGIDNGSRKIIVKIDTYTKLVPQACVILLVMSADDSSRQIVITIDTDTELTPQFSVFCLVANSNNIGTITWPRIKDRRAKRGFIIDILRWVGENKSVGTDVVAVSTEVEAVKTMIEARSV